MSIIIPRKANAAKGILTAHLVANADVTSTRRLYVGNIHLPGERRSRQFQIESQDSPFNVLWGAAAVCPGYLPEDPAVLDEDVLLRFKRATVKDFGVEPPPSAHHVFMSDVPAYRYPNPDYVGFYNPESAPLMKLWAWTGYDGMGNPMMIGHVEKHIPYYKADLEEPEHPQRDGPPHPPTEYVPDFQRGKPRAAALAKEMSR